MNTKFIISLGTMILVSSSLLAFSPCPNKKQCNGVSSKQQKMMKEQHQSRGHGFIDMFNKLDLSDEQRTEIRSIVKTSMKNMPNPHTSFSDNGFDKDEFVKLVKQRRDNRIEHRANIIEKAYKVLNSAQKKDFKTMLDMLDMMKKNNKMKKSCAK